MSKDILPCHPPPVERSCSRFNTVLIKNGRSLTSSIPTHCPRQDKTHPARIELVPKPLPCGSMDVDMISSPIDSPSNDDRMLSISVVSVELTTETNFSARIAHFSKAHLALGLRKSDKSCTFFTCTELDDIKSPVLISLLSTVSLIPLKVRVRRQRAERGFRLFICTAKHTTAPPNS